MVPQTHPHGMVASRHGCIGRDRRKAPRRHGGSVSQTGIVQSGYHLLVRSFTIAFVVLFLPLQAWAALVQPAFRKSEFNARQTCARACTQPSTSTATNTHTSARNAKGTTCNHHYPSWDYLPRAGARFLSAPGLHITKDRTAKLQKTPLLLNGRPESSHEEDMSTGESTEGAGDEGLGLTHAHAHTHVYALLVTTTYMRTASPPPPTPPSPRGIRHCRHRGHHRVRNPLP